LAAIADPMIKIHSQHAHGKDLVSDFRVILFTSVLACFKAKFHAGTGYFIQSSFGAPLVAMPYHRVSSPLLEAGIQFLKIPLFLDLAVH
jgi:hypothetical protein